MEISTYINIHNNYITGVESYNSKKGLSLEFSSFQLKNKYNIILYYIFVHLGQSAKRVNWKKCWIYYRNLQLFLSFFLYFFQKFSFWTFSFSLLWTFSFKHFLSFKFFHLSFKISLLNLLSIFLLNILSFVFLSKFIFWTFSSLF